MIIALKCHELHGQQLLPQNYKFCQTMGARNALFDYKSLMNSTFGLVPGGRSPGTYRLGEVSGNPLIGSKGLPTVRLFKTVRKVSPKTWVKLWRGDRPSDEGCKAGGSSPTTSELREELGDKPLGIRFGYRITHVIR